MRKVMVLVLVGLLLFGILGILPTGSAQEPVSLELAEKPLTKAELDELYQKLAGMWTDEQYRAFRADADGDGVVGLCDLILVALFYGERVNYRNRSSIRADRNSDGWINREDVLIVSAGWGLIPPVSWRNADPNGDGQVRWRDYHFIRGWFGVPLTGNPKGWSCTVNFVDEGGFSIVDIIDFSVFRTFFGLPLRFDCRDTTGLKGILEKEGISLPALGESK